jgi:osmotically-inducible protein OsmY
MRNEQVVVERVEAALRRMPELDFARYPIGVKLRGDVLTMEGEVSDIAAKKLALEQGAMPHEVRWVEDRIRVAPAVAMGDGEIRDHVRDALLGEPSLTECAVRLYARGAVIIGREPPLPARGAVDVSIDRGVVTLDGRTPSLSHKRLAGVLCWWVPGVRDVVNALAVVPPEEDNDGELADALRLVYDKNPFLDGAAIGVHVEGSIVTLHGSVASDEQRGMAERDAWFVSGVGHVVNRIEVHRA